jgi:hypothetical protein
MENILFVLGGNDGEMEVIKNLLSAAGIASLQPVKGWGQKFIRTSAPYSRI